MTEFNRSFLYTQTIFQYSCDCYSHIAIVEMLVCTFFNVLHYIVNYCVSY